MTAGWIALLFVESSRPPVAIMGGVQGLDKFAHFFAFGGLDLLIYALIFQLRLKTSLTIISLPFFLTVFIGYLEEGYQMLVPGRSGSLPDLLADSCGALFATLLANCLTPLSQPGRIG